jgi:hypothetical protein
LAAKAASPRWRHFGRGVSRGMLSHSQDAVRSDTMRTGGGSLDIARLLKLDLLDLRVVAPGDGAFGIAAKALPDGERTAATARFGRS